MHSKENVTDYASAVRHMMNRDFLFSLKHEEQHWRANREGAHPRILEFEKALIARFHKLGIPMYAHCVVRTREEQDSAYARGVSRIKGSEPYPHRFAAVDIIHGTKAWELPVECWDMIGHVGQEVAKSLSIPMVWGGDWDGDGDKHDQKLYDPAHWELAFWRGMEPVAPFMHLYGRSPRDDV